jgi:hypothetical protein
VRIAFRQLDDQRRDVLREEVAQVRRVCQQDLLHAGGLRRRLGRVAAIVAGDEDMHVGVDLLRRGERVERRLAHRPVVVLRENQDRHQSTFASLRSLSTSAFTSATLAPALRFEGSTTLRVSSRLETSTPSASGLMFSSVFFLAFMMFGSVT